MERILVALVTVYWQMSLRSSGQCLCCEVRSGQSEWSLNLMHVAELPSKHISLCVRLSYYCFQFCNPKPMKRILKQDKQIETCGTSSVPSVNSSNVKWLVLGYHISLDRVIWDRESRLIMSFFLGEGQHFFSFFN